MLSAARRQVRGLWPGVVQDRGPSHLRRQSRDEGGEDGDADQHVDGGEELAGVRLGREVAVADGGGMTLKYAASTMRRPSTSE